MRRILKWIGIVLGGLVGLVTVAAIAIFIIVTLRLNATYDIDAETDFNPENASPERGEHLVNAVSSCTACHGDNLSGDVVSDDPLFLTIYAPNLTAGEGGAGSAFSDQDFVRAIRHGVDPDGKPLLFMPAHRFYFMSDEDLRDILAYIRSVEPVDNLVPEPSLGPLGYVFMLLDDTLLPARFIDHAGQRPDPPEPGVTIEYGEYLVSLGTCADCHGPDLNGALSFGPGEPPSANLTPNGELVDWSAEDFIQTIRTGVNPAGRRLQEPMASAVEIYGLQTDEELAAIFTYLQSLPALENGY